MMETHMIFILVLLLQVVLDAVGDGLRVRGWQKAHHTMETLREGIWIALIASVFKGYLDFQWYYIWMYMIGRVWLFDLVINPIMKQKLWYISKSSWDGAFYYWVTGDGDPDRKRKTPVFLFAGMLKFIALIWWVAWFITNMDR